MKTVILCGGKGTRAYPHTIDVPKPLMEVGDRPVLAHVMELYARQGFTEFVLAAGYRCDLIERFAEGLPATWAVDVVDTGEDTETGGRILGCRDHLRGTFLVTYADGLGNVSLHALLDTHASHPGAATLTTVPLPSQYGTVETGKRGEVVRFTEKPRLPDHRINAGFFAFDERVFEQWDGEDLERQVLPALAARSELFVYCHDGFWRSMDTYKDAVELSELCLGDEAPWFDSPATPG